MDYFNYFIPFSVFLSKEWKNTNLSGENFPFHHLLFPVK